jgi:hypothetical protein
VVFCITFLHFVSDLPPVVLQIQSQTKKVLINLKLAAKFLLDTMKIMRIRMILPNLWE